MKKVARIRLSDSQESSQQANSDTMSVRTTGRKKKPKAVFDPSDNYLPRSQRPIARSVSPTHSNESQVTPAQAADTTTTTAAAAAEPVEVCDVCSKREAKRGAHSRNKLVACIQCQKYVHKLCMLEEFDNFEKLRRLHKCEDCRSCSVCHSKFTDKRNCIICTSCVKPYHFQCHTPSLPAAKFREADVRRNWKCKICTQIIERVEVSSDEEVIAKEVPNKTVQTANKTETKANTTMPTYRKMSTNMSNGANESLTKSKFPMPMEIEKQPISKKPLPTPAATARTASTTTTTTNGSYNILEKHDLPNVKDWTVNQVTQYMTKYFPKEASIFKEHEIDGASLLLMRRSDIVKKLNLKLGPSLRIYSLILKIQTQKNDPTLGWNCSK